jgi:hypothetical protein
MGPLKRVLSSAILACGIVVVFAGLSLALGFTVPAMIASITLIAALLYAGGLWFGGASTRVATAGSDLVIVFDRSLKVTAGPAPGTSLLLQFPEVLRPEIEMRCRLALRGEHTHFECEHAGARIAFDIAPVQSIQGMVLYGVLISGSGTHVPAGVPAPLTTVA